MYPLRSRVDNRSQAFQENVEANLASLEKLNSKLAKARAGGGEKYVTRHKQRGKLLPRERVENLLDRGSPFLELCPLAGVHIGGTVPGGSAIAGIGWVSGVECMVTATDSTVQGGAITPVGLQKSERVAQIAFENRLPAVHLIESAGADLPNQADIFVPKK